MKLKTHVDQITRGQRGNFSYFTSIHNSKHATVGGLLPDCSHSSSYLASSTCPDPTQGTCAHPLPRSVTHQLLHECGHSILSQKVLFQTANNERKIFRGKTSVINRENDSNLLFQDGRLFKSTFKCHRADRMLSCLS